MEEQVEQEAQGTTSTEGIETPAESASPEESSSAQTNPGDYEARLQDPQFAADQAKNFQRKFSRKNEEYTRLMEQVAPLMPYLEQDPTAAKRILDMAMEYSAMQQNGGAQAQPQQGDPSVDDDAYWTDNERVLKQQVERLEKTINDLRGGVSSLSVQSVTEKMMGHLTSEVQRLDLEPDQLPELKEALKRKMIEIGSRPDGDTLLRQMNPSAVQVIVQEALGGRDEYEEALFRKRMRAQQDANKRQLGRATGGGADETAGHGSAAQSQDLAQAMASALEETGLSWEQVQRRG